MAFAISATVAIGLGAAAIGIGYMATQKAPEIPKPAEPIAPPESQAAKLPDAQNTVKALGGSGQAGGAPGVAQTFLTGPGGIDQGSLLLGKTTLLGG